MMPSAHMLLVAYTIDDEIPGIGIGDIENAPEVKHENVFKEEVFDDRSASRRMSPMYRSNNETTESKSAKDDEEFDLSNISAKPLTREEIIAAAEAAAFEE